MNLKESFTINSKVVYKTSQKLLDLDLYKEEDMDDTYNLVLYAVNHKKEVKAVITVEADCGQNVGYISDWRIENV